MECAETQRLVCKLRVYVLSTAVPATQPVQATERCDTGQWARLCGFLFGFLLIWLIGWDSVILGMGKEGEG